MINHNIYIYYYIRSSYKKRKNLYFLFRIFKPFFDIIQESKNNWIKYFDYDNSLLIYLQQVEELLKRVDNIYLTL